MQPIFSQYAQLYPAMKKMIDLSDETTVRNFALILRQSMERPFDNSHYMPVTRDLSVNKRVMIISWLKSVEADKTHP